ncbi:MAG: RND transporter [Paracoccaceae bacterium]
MKLIKKIPLRSLIIASLFLGLMPFVPEPHVWQKLKMLFAGELSNGLDIFDLLFHGAPWILLGLKLWTIKSEGRQDIDM